MFLSMRRLQPTKQAPNHLPSRRKTRVQCLCLKESRRGRQAASSLKMVRANIPQLHKPLNLEVVQRMFLALPTRWKHHDEVICTEKGCCLSRLAVGTN